MQCNPGNYRLRLVLDFSETIVLPAVFLTLVLPFLPFQLGLLTIPVYFGSIFVWATTRGAYFEFKQRREARSLGARPIPQVIGKWPGNLDILLRMIIAFRTSYILDVYLQLFEQYQSTTLNLRILWRDNVISMDQEHSKFAWTTGFQLFWRGIAQKERMELFLGSGIFNRDDEAWKLHRNTARPFFLKDRFPDFEIFEGHSARTLSIIALHEGYPLDVQDLFGRFVLDAASEFLFGKNLDTLSGTLPLAGEAKLGPKGSLAEDSWGSFAAAFEMAQLNITNRARLGSIWPLFELFKDKNEKHCQVIRQWLYSLVQHAVDERAEMEKAGNLKYTYEKSFLHHLVQNTTDPVFIGDQLLNMLLAARDTTTATLTFMVYFMALDPEITKKLREEVLKHCGPTDAPTIERIRNMKYMRAVINETLRLFPPVPLNIRETRQSGCVLPRSDATYPEAAKPPPLYMPARTTFLITPLLTQRNPSLWGDDADEFNPDRWIDPQRSAKISANPAMYTPFGAGPRLCLGQSYAYNQMSYFLVRLLQQFDGFTLAPEAQPVGSHPPQIWKSRKGRQSFERIWPAAALTVYVKGGLWVRFHRPAMQ